MSVLSRSQIQDMAKEEDTDVGSLIAFGAKALFAEEEAAVKHYSSEDVDGIIQRAETAEDVSEADGGGGGGMKFDYAEIYDGSKDAAAEGEAPAIDADEDFWDAIVKRATKEKEEREEAGRGARRSKKVGPAARAAPSHRLTQAFYLATCRRPTPSNSTRRRLTARSLGKIPVRARPASTPRRRSAPRPLSRTRTLSSRRATVGAPCRSTRLRSRARTARRRPRPKSRKRQR